jgi:hypothetical protein
LLSSVPGNVKQLGCQVSVSVQIVITKLIAVKQVKLRVQEYDMLNYISSIKSFKKKPGKGKVLPRTDPEVQERESRYSSTLSFT